MPNFLIENEQDGRVCGLDEVGRGPLAGPVVAACVFIPEDKRTLDFVADIKDSKKITFPKLEMLYELITEHFEYGVAEISPAEIDEINILQASLKAMSKAFDNMASLRATAKQSMDCRVGLCPPRNDVVFLSRTRHLVCAGRPCSVHTICKGRFGQSQRRGRSMSPESSSGCPHTSAI